jgi:Flp pilus assembly protein TadG
MMAMRSFISGLVLDRRGGVLVEFALLAPVLMTLMVGVVQVGIHVQNANAVRNLASDGARAAVVEYQRGNTLTASQIAADIQARGVGPKYNLRVDRLDVQVTEQSPSQINGVTEMRIAVTYEMTNFLAFVDLSALDIEYERPVFLLPPS